MKSIDQKEFLGGQGTVHFDHVLEAEEMHGMNRVYARLSLPKGSSVGYHVHSGDGEDYYVLKGTATIDDNHERIVTLKEGEHFFTPSGRGHSLANLGEEELQVMALIIYDHEKE
jgi:mannose-6-phosphate isomerase-like protein (cupin superfamily)